LLYIVYIYDDWSADQSQLYLFLFKVSTVLLVCEELSRHPLKALGFWTWRQLATFIRYSDHEYHKKKYRNP